MDALRGNIKAVFYNVVIKYRILPSGFTIFSMILCFKSHRMIHGNKHNAAQIIDQAID